jgi:hypothetical protein
MGTGATRDYDVGPKNHWRRTIWNEILRRTAGQEKEKLILFLAGPQDLDRNVALQKGVPDLRRRLTHVEDDRIGTGEKGHRRCRRLDPRERRPVASSLPTFAGRTALWPSMPPADDSPDTGVSGPPCIARRRALTVRVDGFIDG